MTDAQILCVAIILACAFSLTWLFSVLFFVGRRHIEDEIPQTLKQDDAELAKKNARTN